jgi:osmotically-inducible protein OsmY
MKKLVFLTLLGLSVPQLTGCVPVVATGVGVGVLMAEDRRTSGTYLIDEEIELKAGNRIREAHGENTHVNLTSYNRRVLLTGEVPDAATRARVQEVVSGVPNVREVQNELAIGPTSGFTARSNDGYITAKVKTRFLDDKRFNAHHVKVVTEAATVYLMGLVKRDEGHAAAEIASRTGGVSKVVKVFEYLD